MEWKFVRQILDNPIYYGKIALEEGQGKIKGTKMNIDKHGKKIIF